MTVDDIENLFYLVAGTSRDGKKNYRKKSLLQYLHALQERHQTKDMDSHER